MNPVLVVSLSCLLWAPYFALGTEVSVRCNGISDHACAQSTDSLAWHLARCGPGDRVLLADAGPYLLESTLTIPAGVRLMGRSQRDSVLKAAPGLLEGSVIRLSSAGVLSHLTVDGDHWPCHLVVGGRIADAVVEHCTFRNTLASSRHPRTPPSSLRCHGLFFHDCDGMIIRCNVIENIGYPTTVPVIAAGIYAPDNRRLNVCDNEIRYTLSAGIDFTGTKDATIARNVIYRNGRNGQLACTATADGITAYHNQKPETDYAILNNKIIESGNHGIHISGGGCRLLGNTIESPAAQGILLGDQYTPPDDCKGCVMDGNRIVGLKQGDNRHAIYIYNNLPTEMVVQSNTPNDIYYRKLAP